MLYLTILYYNVHWPSNKKALSYGLLCIYAFFINLLPMYPEYFVTYVPARSFLSHIVSSLYAAQMPMTT